MSKLDQIQKDLSNDLRLFREPFFEDMEEVRPLSAGHGSAGESPSFRVRDLAYFESWRISGIVGGRRPSTYSESPRLWNSYFRKLGIKGVFFGLDLPIEGDFKEFLEVMLDVQGMLDLTITDPYKHDAFQALDYMGLPIKWSDQAVHTETVNHIILDSSQKELIALNTDGIGMFGAVNDKIQSGGKRVLILGAGGSAASIGYEFVRAGCDLTIMNRTVSRAEGLGRLLDQFKESGSDIRWTGFERLAQFLGEADVVISTVAEGCPIHSGNETYLKEGVLLAETKYGPKADLKDLALRRGLDYVDGRDMLFGQFLEAAAHVFPLLGVTRDRHDAVIREMKEKHGTGSLHGS